MTLELLVPVTVVNVDLGNFMTPLDLYSANGSTVRRASRPVRTDGPCVLSCSGVPSTYSLQYDADLTSRPLLPVGPLAQTSALPVPFEFESSDA